MDQINAYVAGKSTAGHVSGSATKASLGATYGSPLNPTAGASLCRAASPQHLAACKPRILQHTL